MKRIFAFFAVVFLSGLVQISAQKIISCTGRGSTIEEARAYALNDMSHVFLSKVQSSAETRQGYSSKKGSYKEMDMRVLVTSEMPIYGAKFNTIENENENANANENASKKYTVEVVLDSADALPLYEVQIKNMVQKINVRTKKLAALSGEKEEKEWQSLYSDYATFEKLELVSKILGKENDIKPEISSADFRIKYEAKAKEITSVEKAASVIAASIKKQIPSEKKIYVYPPLFEGDNVSTDFSMALANGIKADLGGNVALTKVFSNSELKGSYYFAPGSVDGDDLIVTYYLCEPDGNVIASSGMIKLPYKAYSMYKYKPRSYDLVKEIASGRTSDPAFGVSIRINGERNNQSFRKNDSLVIEVRATSACYIYVTGYVYNDEGKPLTYLFPLNPYADGKEMFVRKISTKEANNWVVINPVIDNEVLNIQVTPPFGEEALQVYASTTTDFDDFTELIPSYIETDDYYVVSDAPVQNVSKTRALNVKRVANKARQVINTAESSVYYSTYEK